MYRSRASAERAYRGYLGSEYGESRAPKNALIEGAILATRGHTAKLTQQKKS